MRKHLARLALGLGLGLLFVSDLAFAASTERTLDSVAQLTAPNTDWSAYSVIHLDAFYAGGTRGGGDLVRQSCTPNKVTCFADSASHTFKRVNPNLTASIAGAVCNGSTDDSTAIQAALTAAGTTDPHNLELIGTSGSRCLMNSSPTIPAGVYVTCDAPFPDRPGTGTVLSGDFTTINNAWILGPSATIAPGNRSQIDRCNVLESALATASAPGSHQDLETNVANFTGTAISATSDGFSLTNSAVIGFSDGISASSIRDLSLNNVNFDDVLCVDLENQRGGGAIALTNINCLPYATGAVTVMSTSITQSILAISTIADCGGANAGLLCVNLSAACTVGSTCPNTGQTVWVNGITSAQSAAGRWTATRLSTTQILLQGSSSAGLGTGLTVTGTTDGKTNRVTGLSSVAQLYPGQSLTGTGVPGSTTIVIVNPQTKTLYLSNLTTASGTNTLTVTDSAGAGAGGSLTQDAAQRTGDGIYLLNDITVNIKGCEILAHRVGLHWGDGTKDATAVNCGIDQSDTLWDQTFAGILSDGASQANSFIGGFIHVTPSILATQAAGAQLGPNVISSVDLGAPDGSAGLNNVAFNLASATFGTTCHCTWVFNNDVAQTTAYGFVSSDLVRAQFANNSARTVTILAQSPTAMGNTYIGATDELRNSTGLFAANGSSGFPVNLPNQAVSAGGSTGQANATLLTSTLNQVTTASIAAAPVMLMPAGSHWCQTVINATANSIQVFGMGTDTVDGAASGTGVPQAAGATVTYCSAVAGTWFGH